MDEFNKAVVRRTVHNFYVSDKCVPTVEKLRLRLSEAIDFKGSNTSLRRILKELGFKWRKTRNNRRILIEREDIRNKRINFIRQMRQFRREGRPIVYTDETYVVTNHVTPSSWQDSTNGGLHVPVGNGDRLIIVHAGGEDGFIPNTFLQWKASQSTGDYHKNMNTVNYEKWVQEKLLPNLKPRSVIIIDNASYHNVTLDKIPTKSSLKADMQAWLTQHNIDFTPTMFKAELLNLIQQNKPPTRYSLDEILEGNDSGHTVLRLPPYHPDLNAIELIWSQIKGYVAERNTQFNMNSIMRLVEAKVSEIGASEWKKCCSHVKSIEDQYFEREQLIDEFHDAVIVDLGQSDSEDSEGADEPSEGEEMDLSGIEEL
ncbi:uncharacterized protein LOC128995564 [Macrosteles quadrilineatus]|uniref:uncharacterized protein LOC128995564 n=1 Tax=Macrosteles quadrilineatus TaxID=74068 RepID=UPI0023E2310A|nr:uncharacterized protein LOC128995564 [Macrosteles quadrilineatus]